MTEKKQLHDSCTLQDYGHEAEHKCECAHQHIACCDGQQAEHKHTCCETEHMAKTHTVLAAADGEGVLTRTYLLQGLGCANCGAKIERAVGQLPEVEAALLTFATKKLQVQVKSGADLLAAVQEVCDSIEEGISVEESGAAVRFSGFLQALLRYGSQGRPLSHERSVRDRGQRSGCQIHTGGRGLRSCQPERTSFGRWNESKYIQCHAKRRCRDTCGLYEIV